MFRSRVFTIWFIVALITWGGLFAGFVDLQFLADHWFYPAVMVLGAFVAGLTPEGGGAVAFPVLSVFFDIDRVLARDFSLMIQSVGMTSASIFILSHRDTVLRNFKPMLVFIPIAFGGFVLGMHTLQNLPVYIIQALFLSLITTFAIAYVSSSHRGNQDALRKCEKWDWMALGVILILGGMCASLFGTGADIILYTLAVTRFGLKEKIATHMSIILMASISILGFSYRHFVDAGIVENQVRTWLCAYPVVLFMAPFGAYVLHRMNVEWMLRGIVVLNIGQLVYFNLKNPSLPKIMASVVFCVILMVVFAFSLSRLARKTRSAAAYTTEPAA